MSNRFDRIFGAAEHPAAAAAACVASAGLSSGENARCLNSWSPVRHSNNYDPTGAYPSSTQFKEWQRPPPGMLPSISPHSQVGLQGGHPRSVFSTFLSSSPYCPTGLIRGTNPLSPVYQLPSPTPLPSLSSPQPSSPTSVLQGPGGHTPSRSLDCSDIPGARSRTMPQRSPERRLQNSYSYSDVAGTRSTTFSKAPTVPGCTESTAGIAGAQPLRRTAHGITSPGRGTLRNDDIVGSHPGRGDAQGTWSMGRFPKPATYRLQFPLGARGTVLQRPIVIGESN